MSASRSNAASWCRTRTSSLVNGANNGPNVSMNSSFVSSGNSGILGNDLYEKFLERKGLKLLVSREVKASNTRSRNSSWGVVALIRLAILDVGDLCPQIVWLLGTTLNNDSSHGQTRDVQMKPWAIEGLGEFDPACAFSTRRCSLI